MKTKFYFKLKQGKSLILLISLCYYSGYSQDPCGLKEVMQNLYDSNPSYYSNISSGRSTCSNNAPYQIPVVFHILHNNGAENISDAQVINALEQANLQFAGGEGGFDTKISFYLAQKDPDGNCTNGIIRVQTPNPGISPLNNSNDSTMKNLSRWPSSQYLNIWIVQYIGDPGGTVGYAYLPPVSSNLDGIVIEHNYLGNSGTANNNHVNTLSHELGHYFNLLHVWGKDWTGPNEDRCIVNCDPNDCENKGDKVCDTDPCKSPTFGSPCGNIGSTFCEDCPNFPQGVFHYPTDNYLSYNHECQNQFTEGQANRMWCAIEDYRLQLPKPYIENCFSECNTIITNQVNSIDGQTFKGNIIVQNGGTLTIQENHIVYMGQDKSIIVETGGQLLLEKSAEIRPCDTYWNKIEVFGNLTTVGFSNKLVNLKNGVYAHPNSNLNLTETIISGTSINNLATGLFINGNVNISRIDFIQIKNFHFGIQNINNTTYNNISWANITNCFQGIYINNAPCRINNCFVNSQYEALTMISTPGMLVENNSLHASPGNDSRGISIFLCDAAVIKNNHIGTLFSYPNTGISLYLSNGGTIKNNSSIKGGTCGIFAFNTDYSILNNTIGATGSPNSNLGALSLFYGNANQILNNTINAPNVTFGILSRLCKGTQIENNSVTTSMASSLYRAAAIKSEGSNAENIENNIVTGSGYMDGIIATNTAGNTYDCNAVTVSSGRDALSVLYNSQGQSVKGNTLSGSGRDLVIRSTIGEQLHRGNKFIVGNAWAESQTIANGSRFFVNSNYANHLPANPNPTNWFSNQPNIHNYYECANKPGPYTMPLWDDATALCGLYNRVVQNDGYNSNAYRRIIQTMLRYEQDRPGYTLPACIKNDPSLPACWKTLVLAEKELKDQNSSKSADRTALVQKIEGLSTAYTTATSAAYRSSNLSSINSLCTSLSINQATYNSKVTSAKNILNSISCSDPIINVAKGILGEYIAYLEAPNKSTFNYTPLINYSRLCADEYGPYVQLARAIVYPVTGEYFDPYDNCSGVVTPRSDESVAVTKIYPNPSNGLVTVDLGCEKDGVIRVLDLNGRILLSKEIVSSRVIALDLTGHSGVVFIQIASLKGVSETIKHIIIN